MIAPNYNKDTSLTKSLRESEVSNNQQRVKGNEATSVSLAGGIGVILFLLLILGNNFDLIEAVYS